MHLDARFLTMASAAATIGVMCVFMCCPQTMRQYPENYLLLAVFTVAEAVMVGVICAQYTVQSVVVAFGITAFVVFSLMLFACTTKHDFTGVGGRWGPGLGPLAGLLPYFFVATLVLCGLGFALCMASVFGASQTGGFRTACFACLLRRFRTMYMLYAGFGALLFSGGPL